MAVRVGINGFGRIGRLDLRAAWGWSEIEFVHINEVKGGAVTAAHLLKFDSVHGRWAPEVEAISENQILIDGKPISFSEFAKPDDVPWEDYGVDIVLECSGKFRTPETLDPYFKRGVKKVIVAAPVKQGALNIVMGINDHLYQPKEHDLITAASCTTNCLAPVVKVIHEGLGIKHGVITTIHDNTNTQTIVDAPHKDLRRARATSLSLIPTTTGSATLTDCVFEVARSTTVEEVNQLLKTAAEGALNGILGYEERPLVSIDYKDDPRSSIIDALSTMVVDETQVKILAWYDNEWGYSNRMVELARKVAISLK
jgi:glyceraldehyde 3-phosphate dehydrogenase